jgi:hypothetical protein
MAIPTLVMSNPPHGDVDLDAVAELLGLDAYITRLKVNFGAPEVLSASGAEEAAEFAASLRSAGLTVSVLDGTVLVGLPWPDPVSSLAFDESGLRATVLEGTIQVPYESEVVAVYCQPPSDFSMEPAVDLEQAVASGHGPTIAEAIQWISILDLYLEESGSLRRISIVPELSGVDAGSVIGELERRFRRLHLDTRLAGVRPRSRFIMGEAGFNPDQRKRYSFGTLLLCHILESISPDLRDVPQFELGSRLAYALSTQQ